MLPLDLSTLQRRCIWTCLLHRGLNCTGTCLDKRSLYRTSFDLPEGIVWKKQPELVLKEDNDRETMEDPDLPKGTVFETKGGP